jgi:uncharacterized OsmC-like protein
MHATEKIKLAFERSEKALSLRPSLGKGTGISVARIKNGLTCEVEEGSWKLTADMPEQVGGNAQGPTPGVYGRAALGSCLAIGYMMRAGKFGIAIHSLQVEVEADYDDGALFGTIDLYPGYLQVRYTVTIETDAPEKDILKLLDEADAHSPYLDIFSRAQECRREIKIVRTKHLA